MNSKLINVKYLAVFLLAIFFLLMVSFDAFSQTINTASKAWTHL